ncbi:MAG: hypothetical protein P4N59_10705 [Negativicutes bacterium]|nr:hypothetical protein [Negativicutes bacterium]
MKKMAFMLLIVLGITCTTPVFAATSQQTKLVAEHCTALANELIDYRQTLDPASREWRDTTIQIENLLAYSSGEINSAAILILQGK